MKLISRTAWVDRPPSPQQTFKRTLKAFTQHALGTTTVPKDGTHQHPTMKERAVEFNRFHAHMVEATITDSVGAQVDTTTLRMLVDGPLLSLALDQASATAPVPARQSLTEALLKVGHDPLPYTDPEALQEMQEMPELVERAGSEVEIARAVAKVEASARAPFLATPRHIGSGAEHRAFGLQALHPARTVPLIVVGEFSATPWREVAKSVARATTGFAHTYTMAGHLDRAAPEAFAVKLAIPDGGLRVFPPMRMGLEGRSIPAFTMDRTELLNLGDDAAVLISQFLAAMSLTNPVPPPLRAFEGLRKDLTSDDAHMPQRPMFEDQVLSVRDDADPRIVSWVRQINALSGSADERDHKEAVSALEALCAYLGLDADTPRPAVREALEALEALGPYQAPRRHEPTGPKETEVAGGTRIAELEHALSQARSEIRSLERTARTHKGWMTRARNENEGLKKQLEEMRHTEALHEGRLEEIESLLRDTQRDNEDLQRELTAKVSQFNELTMELNRRGLSDLVLAVETMDEQAAYSTLTVSTVTEACTAAQRELGDWLVLPDEAMQDLHSIDTSPSASGWGNSTWRGLQALAAYAKHRAHGWSGGTFRDWCREGHPMSWSSSTKKLAMAESDTVMNSTKLSATRVFPVSRDVDPSGRLTMEAHLKIATGGGQNAPRVYFHDDTANTGKVHIGLVGPHSLVPNTKTN